MNKRTLQLICLSTLTVGIASAASSYQVKIYDDLSVGNTAIKAGEYKVAMQGDNAVFIKGKTSIEVPATMSTVDKKFDSTAVLKTSSKLTEIDLGGTKNKIVFSSGAGPSSNGN